MGGSIVARLRASRLERWRAEGLGLLPAGLEDPVDTPEMFKCPSCFRSVKHVVPGNPTEAKHKSIQQPLLLAGFTALVSGHHDLPIPNEFAGSG